MLHRSLWLFYKIARKFLKIVTGYSAPAGFRNVLVTCPLSRKNLEDFVEKVRWYAPDTVNFYLITKDRIDTPPNVFINEKADYDFYLILSRLCILRNFFRLHRSAVIDPYFYSTEECTAWSYLYGQAVNTPEVFRHISMDNFMRLADKLSGKTQACCFLTGQSFDEYRNHPELKNMVKIICNSVVKNDEFMEQMPPDILMFADPVYHFSYNEYSVSFRQDVLKTVKKYDTYVVIPENMMPLMLAHYPELKERLIGFGTKPEFGFPDFTDMTVKSTDNILTYLMLPTASALCTEIYILGADGRSPSDKMFWKHNSSVQYDALMQKVVDAHPSFFRDRDYIKYQDSHDKSMEALFSFGEANGRHYISLNRSHLASINARYKEA